MHREDETEALLAETDLHAKCPKVDPDRDVVSVTHGSHCQKGNSTATVHITAQFSLWLQQEQSLQAFDTKTVLPEIKQKKEDAVYIL